MKTPDFVLIEFFELGNDINKPVATNLVLSHFLAVFDPCKAYIRVENR